MVGPPFAQLNLGSAVAAVAAAVTCCRLSISCSGWFDGSEAADVAVVVAIDPELEMEPQCEKKDIWVAQVQLSFPDLGTCVGQLNLLKTSNIRRQLSSALSLAELPLERLLLRADLLDDLLYDFRRAA